MNRNTTRESKDVSAKTIGEVVAADYRAATVFDKYGIDFCCGGKVPFSIACRKSGADPSVVIREIEAAGSNPLESSENYAAWELSILADYIIDIHHIYLDENMYKISAHADKIAEVHGDVHPELIEIARIFSRIRTRLAAHLLEEEEVVFPAIKRIEAAATAGAEPDVLDRKTVMACLAKLDHEHAEICQAVHTIRDLSSYYSVPGHACSTFVLTYRMLKRFDEDLHMHLHLENNILFPKVTHR